MNPRAMMDGETLVGWLPVTLDASIASAPGFLRCIEVASQDIESACARRFISESYACWHSGDRAYRCCGELYLTDRDQNGLLATSPITAITKVEEDGIALSVVQLASATSFVDGEAALVSAASGRIQRATISGGKISLKAWASGVANIRVEWTAGYTKATATGGGTMPADIVQVCCELADMYRKEGARGGIETLGEMGANLSFVRLLSPNAKRILRGYTLSRMPQTAEL